MFGKYIRRVIQPWNVVPAAVCFADQRNMAFCQQRAAEVVLHANQLHSYWDKHDADSFEQRSISGGRIPALRRVAEIALKLAAEKPDAAFVDLGCGTGLFAKLLGPINILGVDISESHLSLARNHMKAVKASYMDWVPDAGSTPPDVAVHNNSIEDYEEAVKSSFFKHVYNWLAPGGYFLFQAYSPRDEPMGRYLQEVSPSFSASHVIHLCDTGDYVRLATAAGFHVMSTELVHSEGEFPSRTSRTYSREFILIVLRKPVR